MIAQRLIEFANRRFVSGRLVAIVLFLFVAGGCGGDAEPPRFEVTLATGIAKDVTLRINSQVCSLEPIHLSRNTMVVVDGTCLWLKPIAQPSQLGKSSKFPTMPSFKPGFTFLFVRHDSSSPQQVAVGVPGILQKDVAADRKSVTFSGQVTVPNEVGQYDIWLTPLPDDFSPSKSAEPSAPIYRAIVQVE